LQKYYGIHKIKIRGLKEASVTSFFALSNGFNQLRGSSDILLLRMERDSDIAIRRASRKAMVKNYLTHEVKGDKKKAIAELWKIKVGWVIKQTPCSVQIISGHVEERVMATPCLSEWEIRDQKSEERV
jgi:hypothetical protein